MCGGEGNRKREVESVILKEDLKKEGEMGKNRQTVRQAGDRVWFVGISKIISNLFVY